MKREKEMTVREYLSLTEKDRISEDYVRPRVEIWPDEWVDWVASHRKDHSNFACYAGGHASPFCPLGHH